MNSIFKEAASTPLTDLDVSDPLRFENDCWQPLFKRLREESPVHYQADSPAGAFLVNHSFRRRR